MVGVLAAMEVYAAFRRAGYHPATLLGLAATLSVLIATYQKGQEALPLVLVVLFVFTMLWHLAGVERVAEPVRSVTSPCSSSAGSASSAPTPPSCSTRPSSPTATASPSCSGR